MRRAGRRRQFEGYPLARRMRTARQPSAVKSALPDWLAPEKRRPERPPQQGAAKQAMRAWKWPSGEVSKWSGNVAQHVVPMAIVKDGRLSRRSVSTQVNVCDFVANPARPTDPAIDKGVDIHRMSILGIMRIARSSPAGRHFKVQLHMATTVHHWEFDSWQRLMYRSIANSYF